MKLLKQNFKLLAYSLGTSILLSLLNMINLIDHGCACFPHIKFEFWFANFLTNSFFLDADDKACATMVGYCNNWDWIIPLEPVLASIFLIFVWDIIFLINDLLKSKK